MSIDNSAGESLMQRPRRFLRSGSGLAATSILFGILLVVSLICLISPSSAAPLTECPAFDITSKFSIAYGDVQFTSSPAPVGSLVTAKSPRGDLVGCFEILSSGKYGAMYIYGEDTSVTPSLPGMRAGEQVTFFLDGAAAQATPRLYWQNDRNLHLADLQAAGELPPVANFSALPTSGYTPLNVQFADLSQGNITDWLWSFGDGLTSTLQSPSHAFAQVGKYTVSLTVNGPGGSDMLTRADYVIVVNGPPTADFSASPLSGNAPLAVTFTNLSTNYAATLWSFGDNSSSAEANPTHVYTQKGNFTVSLAVLGPGGIASQIKNAYISVNSLTHSGKVQYWNNERRVSGALLTLAGAQTYTATSSATGVYTISNIQAGDYILTPSKSNDANGITAYDASLVLRHTAELITLSGPAASAADVTHNGSISSLDGSYIIRKAVNLITLPFPGATHIWEFNPASRSYTGLQNSQTDQNFTAILLGDPSGSWTDMGATAQRRPGQPQTPAILEIQGGRAESSGLATATVQLDPAASPVYSLDLILTYDPAVAQFLGSTTTALTSDWLLETNPDPAGEIRIGLASAQPLAGAGQVLTLSFRLPDRSKKTSLTPQASLNEGQIPVTLLPGTLGGQVILYLPLVRR